VLMSRPSFHPTVTLSPRPVPCTPHQTPAPHAMAIDHVHARATGVTDLRDLGIWDQIMDALAVAHDATVQMIDTSIIHVHQHGAFITNNGGIVVFLIKPGGSKIIIHLFFNDLPLPTRRGKFCCLLLQPKNNREPNWLPQVVQKLSVPNTVGRRCEKSSIPLVL